MKIYLILFKDGSFSTSKSQPALEHYQIGARIFECEENTSIQDVASWTAHGFPAITKNIREVAV